MNTPQTGQNHDTLSQVERLLEIADANAALRMIQELVRRQPGNIAARRLQARALLQLNRCAQALEVLDIADTYRQIEPTTITANEQAEHLLLRSKALGRMGRMDESQQALEAALRHEPEHPSALRRLACLQRRNGQIENAIETCKLAIEQQPDDITTLRTLAECYEVIGCAEKALTMYQRLDGLRDSRAVSIETARSMRRAGRLPEAVVAFDLLVQQRPHDAELAIEAADLSREMGDDQRATKYLRQVLAHQPNCVAAMDRLAEQGMRAGRFAQAGRLWWRRWRVDRSAAEGCAGLLVCAHMTEHTRLADRCRGELAEHFALDYCHKVIARLWQTAMPGRMLIDLFEARTNETNQHLLPALLTEAERAIGQRLEHYSDHADLHYHRGMARRAIGQSDQAARCFDRALRINGGYEAAARQRIDLLLVEDNLDAAEAVMMSVRRHRGQTEVLADIELVLHVFRNGTQKAIEFLLAQHEDTHSRACLCEQVAETLMRHDSSLADQWITACRNHPALPEPFAWRDAA